RGRRCWSRGTPFFPAVEAGLMGSGGEGVGVVAEAEFDIVEELAIGGIDEGLRHVAEGAVGGGPQLRHQGADARFTVFRGGGRGWSAEVQHGCHLAVEAAGAYEFRTLPTAYPDGRHFPPNFLNGAPNEAEGFFLVAMRPPPA